MKWLAVAGILLVFATLILILSARRRSIKGRKAQQNHFQHLAQLLGFQFVSDDYFVQLEGRWNSRPAIILPHHFEGPGSVTLIYLETGIPAVERNWIEPNLSMGRALVEWKRKSPYGYEVSGTNLPSERVLAEMKLAVYPYVAVTLPWRFSYSPLLQKSLSSWKNFAVLLVLDEGRRPSKQQIENALNCAARIALVCNAGVPPAL